LGHGVALFQKQEQEDTKNLGKERPGLLTRRGGTDISCRKRQGNTKGPMRMPGIRGTKSSMLYPANDKKEKGKGWSYCVALLQVRKGRMFKAAGELRCEKA